MTTPFFSLITPVYRIEKLIAATIESALAQTCDDWEMICIDDGSPDRAGAICDAYASRHPEIHVIHKENAGLAAARNDGIKAAHGQYILMFEGSDVFPHEDTLQWLKAQIIAHDDPDIVFGLMQEQMENSGEIFSTQKAYKVADYQDKHGEQLLSLMLRNDEVLGTSSPVNKLYRRQFILRNDIWFFQGLYHDDDEWIPRAIALTKSSLVINEVIYTALSWDGCFGRMQSEKAILKKASDLCFIALHCCNDFTRRFTDVQMLDLAFQHYIRFYLGAIANYRQLNSPAAKKQLYEAIDKSREVLHYALYTSSRNRKVLYYISKVVGMRLTVALVNYRYQ